VSVSLHPSKDFIHTKGKNTMDNYYDVLPNESNTFLMLPGEKTILHRRQHMFAVIIPIVIASLLAIGIMAALFVGFALFYHAFHLMLVSWAIVVIAAFSLITKTIIDWYLHMYLVTNRRILEIQYKPFFSQDVNDVLLDQVRCTEIDVKIHGYIHGLMDVGDIIITFDRPTHQQEFVLHDIKSPRKIGTLLGHLLNTPKDANTTTWYKESGPQNTQYFFTEELFPRGQFSAV
jgi:hypothetical protein